MSRKIDTPVEEQLVIKRFPNTLRQRLKVEAAKAGVSLRELVMLIFIEWLEELNETPPPPPRVDSGDNKPVT